MDDGTGHLIRLHSVIGMGAYGTVFKAFRLPKEHADREEMWSSAAQAVAVKETVFRDVSDDITVVLKEVSYLSNLQHPNIVAYFTAFTNSDDGRSVAPSSSLKTKKDNGEEAALGFSEAASLCIVEELVEGASVAKVIKMISEGRITRSLSEAEIAAVVYDVLQALLYIHEGCRLVHRDIKPLNMLLDYKTASVKLCDFGTCADMNQQSGHYTVIGTIGWIAPEVLDSGMMDCRSGYVTSHSFPSDVWSLGVSVLEMARSNIRKTALSEYIRDLSASSCSAQPAPESSRKSFLDGKLPSGPMRDFIACCLRKDPLVRPTVSQLLQHPFIVENSVEDAQTRQSQISSILAAVKSANNLDDGSEGKMLDDAIVLPQCASSTLVKNRCMKAIATIKREFFASQSPLSEKSRTSHYSWCLPEHLAQMLSSDDYRYMPTPSRPQGLGQVPGGSVLPAQTRNTAPLKPLFDSVILPAIVESQRVALGIMRKHRRLAGSSTADGWEDVDARNEVRYSLSELACRDLKHERFIQLHDELLRTFKAASMAIPDFEANFLLTFMQSLTSVDNDVHSLRRFIAYIHQLQKEDFMHTHHGHLESSNTKASASRGDTAAVRTPRPITFRVAEDFLRVPRIPQSAGSVDAGGRGGGSETNAIQQKAHLVNPSAYLFNEWLKGKQASLLGPL